MRNNQISKEPIFQYYGLDPNAQKTSDTFLLKKNTVNGTKQIVFNRVSNGNLLDKIANFLSGFSRPSANKIQQFLQSRGLNAEESHTATKFILNNNRSAAAFETIATQHKLSWQVALPE